MKNHELLDMIGDVNEDYVLDAGDNVVKPRFGWKAIAACAACAALVLGAYPLYQAAHPALHDYTVVEGGGTLTTEGDLKAPAGGQIDIPGQNPPAPNPDQPSQNKGSSIMPGGAYVGGDTGETGIDGSYYSESGLDAPIQEKAAAQYLGLLQGLGGQGGYEPETYPDWFAGAWIDNSYYPEAKLAVAIVGSFRTPELEGQIREWCGGTGGVVLVDAKYSKNHLDGLMDPVTKALDGTGLSCGIGVDVTANCLGVDIYSDGAVVPNKVLAELARLDPDGDAIRVRLFTGKLDTLTDEIVKGPAPDVPAADPVAPEERATPTVTEDAEPFPTPIDGDSQPDAYAPVPGGVTQPAAAEQEGGARESSQPAGSLPGYGLIYGAGQ